LDSRRGGSRRRRDVRTHEAVERPQSLVEQVAAVEADLDLTGVHTNFQQTLLLYARDDQGGDMKTSRSIRKRASQSC
jgi:hypothetical protein